MFYVLLLYNENHKSKMEKKSQNVTENVTKVNEMSVISKIEYLYSLGKEADVKHENLKNKAIDFLGSVNSDLCNYPINQIHEAINDVFDLEKSSATKGWLHGILLGLEVKQIYAINRVIVPVLDADMMFMTLDGITSLDEMIKVCETFLNK